MENKLSAVAAPQEIELAPVAVAKPVQASVREPKTPVAPEPDLRLVIEESGEAGGFVYKTIDRRSGEVVLQLPREEVLRLRDAEAYAAGDVIATQA